MMRRLFTLLAALSLLLCAAVCVLWARSYRTGVTIAFRWADSRWQAGAERGRLWLDDAPQRAWERKAAVLKYQRDMQAEYARLKREHEAYEASLAARTRPSVGPEDFPPGTPDWVWRKAVVVGGDEQRRRIEGYREITEQSSQRMRAVLAAYMSGTVPRPVRRSASLAWPVGAAAVLPALWLGGFIRRRWKARRLRRQGCCVQCGYDLRASPERCPECGAPAEVRA